MSWWFSGLLSGQKWSVNAFLRSVLQTNAVAMAVSWSVYKSLDAVVSPGRHGRHLFSTEPEDKSACVGARGSIQSRSEAQHEETHLNRHVGQHAPPALQFWPRSESDAHTQATPAKPKSWPVQPPVSHFKAIYLTHPTYAHTHTHIHTGLSCSRRGRGERSHICYCSGDRLVFISMAFICTRPPRLSFFLPQNGEETHQLMFSFTVIGWFKAASVNCAPPPSHPPHCSPSAFDLPQLPPSPLTFTPRPLLVCFCSL